MTNPADIEARLSAVETDLAQMHRTLDAAASDAAAARHLAAARDRDLSDLAIKVDANRQAINALGVQTAARFDQVDQRFDRLEQHVDRGFAEMRALLDQTAGGMAQVVELLTNRDDQ